MTKNKKIFEEKKDLEEEQINNDNEKQEQIIIEKKEENIDYKDRYLRALADYQNLVKRSGQEKQDFVKYANEQLIVDILPIYDNLKISLSHIDEEAQKQGWAQGIKYVVKQFKEMLENNGVFEIKTLGEKFDPYTMEALEGDGEIVLSEVKTGYKLGGKVIVPAKVKL